MATKDKEKVVGHLGQVFQETGKVDMINKKMSPDDLRQFMNECRRTGKRPYDGIKARITAYLNEP